MPLTGGYRRKPSLQIGADVYCDTQVMLAEIERRHPSPSLIPAGLDGMVWAFNLWADRLFFQTTVPIIFGTIGDQVPEAFLKDREQLFRSPVRSQGDESRRGAVEGPVASTGGMAGGPALDQCFGLDGGRRGPASPTPPPT